MNNKFIEPMIAGKTHIDIVSMKDWMRWEWYKIILPEEKERAMRVLETVRRTKISEAMTGENNPNFGGLSKEHRAKIGVSNTGKIRTEETRLKISKVNIGKILTEETKGRISAWWTSERRNQQSEVMIELLKDPKKRDKMSAALIELWKDPGFRDSYSGKNHHNWKNGASFKPYCYLFNEKKKEEIRNRDNRVCQLCGKSEILNSKRLAVHHIDGDKMQGCDGKKWQLVALCTACNSKSDTVEKEFLIISNLAWKL